MVLVSNSVDETQHTQAKELILSAAEKPTVDIKVLCEKLAVIYADTLPEGVIIGMKDGSIIFGTKKEEERTVAAVRPQNEYLIG